MFENLISTKTMNLLQSGLDAATARQRVIADNIANVDTPGFKKSEVVFENELQKALNNDGGMALTTTDPRHIPINSGSLAQVKPQVVKNDATSMRADGNNVDIDVEMGELTKNSIKYETLVQLLNSEIQKIKSAIDGR